MVSRADVYRFAERHNVPEPVRHAAVALYETVTCLYLIPSKKRVKQVNRRNYGKRIAAASRVLHAWLLDTDRDEQ